MALQAVITVPASFSSSQREAMRVAGTMAGLQVAFCRGVCQLLIETFMAQGFSLMIMTQQLHCTHRILALIAVYRVIAGNAYCWGLAAAGVTVREAIC